MSSIGVGVYPGTFSCGLKTNGSIDCWGADTNGQATPPAGTYTNLAVGGDFACAVKDDGSLACWGANGYGQSTPPAGTDYAELAAARYHICALKTDGSLACWGQSGFGKTTPPAGTDYIAVAAGRHHNCAVKTDNSVVCWGENTDGKLTPAAGSYQDLGLDYDTSCGLKTDGSLACWGRNSHGQATPPAGTDYTAVVGGENVNCALKTDGSLACWGRDHNGQSSPSAGTDYTGLSVGVGHGCATKTDGSVACWGLDGSGQATPPVATDFGPNPSTCTGGGGLAGAGCDADHEAVMFYNEDENALQYCNGTDWVSVVNGTNVQNPGLVGTTMAWDPANSSTNTAFTNGNLTADTAISGGNEYIHAAFSLSSGQWYWENIINASSGTMRIQIGVCIDKAQAGQLDPNNYFYGMRTGSAVKSHTTHDPYGVSLSIGDNIGVALDIDAGTLEYFVNGASQGIAFTGLPAGNYFPCIADGTNTADFTLTANFGASSFAHAAPSGFLPPDSALASSSCTSPEGDAGTLVYNQNEGVMQFCDGAAWQSLGPKVIGGGADTSDLSPPEPSSTDLQMHLRLDDTSGSATAADVTGNQTATLTNMDAASDWVSSPRGGALDFDGTDDFVRAADFIPDGIDTLTVSAWVKADVLAGAGLQNTIVKQDENATNTAIWGLDYDQAVNSFRFSIQNSSNNFISSEHPSPNVGQWYHITGVYDGAETKLFIDGVLVDSDNQTGAIKSSNATIAIGSKWSTGVYPTGYSSYHFDGQIDDVRVYTRDLSDDEVAALYKAGSLRMHLAFDDSTGSATAADDSGNGNTGTLTNMDENTDWVAGKLGAGALDFDGTDDFVRVADPIPDGTDQLTVSAWVKADSWDGDSSGFDAILNQTKDSGADDIFSLEYRDSDGQIYFEVRNDSNVARIASISAPLVDEWFHMVGIYDGVDVKLFIDGVSVNTNGLTGNLFASDNIVSVGTKWANGIYSSGSQLNPFDGQIDDVRIYNRALSDAEVLDLYNQTSGITDGSCLNPDGVGGTLVYNDDNNVMQYCNAERWVALGNTDPALDGEDGGGTVGGFDDTPDAFTFNDVMGASISSVISSNVVTISGMNSGTTVLVSGGTNTEYTLDGGTTWIPAEIDSAPNQGSISNGGTIQIRTTSGSTLGNTQDVVVTIGGVSDTWSVSTAAPDTTPNAFTFTDQTGVPTSALRTSNTITISGINAATPVSVSGQGSPQISINGGAWGTSGTINNGQSLAVRLTSSGSTGVSLSATVDVGGVTDGWSVATANANCTAASRTWGSGNCTATVSAANHGANGTATINNPGGCGTAYYGSATYSCSNGTFSYSSGSCSQQTACDTTPNSYNFTNQSNVATSTLIYSNTVTISGINTGTPVSVGGQGSPQISINGGAWGTSGTITNGQSLRVRLTSSGSGSTAHTATVNVGGVTDDWSVTTASACGGYEYDGYCYYASGYNASCDTACSSRGGCDLTGTRYIGSSGTSARCHTVLTALGIGSGATTDYSLADAGCAFFNLGGWGTPFRVRSPSPVTTCSAEGPILNRACACNN